MDTGTGDTSCKSPEERNCEVGSQSDFVKLAPKRSHEVQVSTLSRYNPQDYWLVHEYEKRSNNINGYPYFFLWEGNNVDLYDIVETAPKGVKIVSKQSWVCEYPLVEVFQMRVTCKEGTSKGRYELSSGSIIFDIASDLAEVYLKGKAQENYLNDGTVLLLPIDTPVDALGQGHIDVNMNIKSNSTEHMITDLDDFINYDHRLKKWIPTKKFIFDIHVKTGAFHRPLSYSVEDKDKKFMVTNYFSIFSDATHATIEISLIDEPDDIYVYGLISARNDMIMDDTHESILFLRENSSQGEKVVSGQPINLYKSMVALQIGHNLIIRAFLRTNDYHFPAAKIVFPSLRMGRSEHCVGNKIRVKVTWKHYWYEFSSFYLIELSCLVYTFFLGWLFC